MLVQLAGLSFRPKSTKLLVAEFEINREFRLEPEPDNPYDPWAVRVIDELTNEFVGYIPRTASKKVAEALDRGYPTDIYAVLHTPDPKTPILEIVNIDE